MRRLALGAALLLSTANCARDAHLDQRPLVDAPDSVTCEHGSPDPQAVRRVLRSVADMEKGPTWFTKDPDPARDRGYGPSGRGDIARWRWYQTLPWDAGFSRINGPLLFDAVLFSSDPDEVLAGHERDPQFPRILIRFAGYHLHAGDRLGYVWKGFRSLDNEPVCTSSPPFPTASPIVLHPAYP